MRRRFTRTLTTVVWICMWWKYRCCPNWKTYCDEQGDSCYKDCTAESRGQIIYPSDPHLPQNNPRIPYEKLKCKGGFKEVKNASYRNSCYHKWQTIHSIKTDIRLQYFMVADSWLVTTGGKSFKWEKTNGIYINGSCDDELSQAFQQLAKNTQHGDHQKLKILSEGKMPEESTGPI